MDPNEVAAAIKANPSLTTWIDASLKDGVDFAGLYKQELETESTIASIVAVILGSSDVNSSLAKLSSIDVKAVMCGAPLNSYDIFWECDTCSTKDQAGMISILCHRCFRKELHKGHDYSFRRGGRGTCDCGDQRCYPKEVSCPDHRLSETIEERKLPQGYKERAQKIFGEMSRLMYLIIEKPELTEQDYREFIIFLGVFMTVRNASALYSPLIAESFMYQKDASSDYLVTHLAKLIIEAMYSILGFNKFMTELVKFHPKLGQWFMIGYWKHYDLILPKHAHKNEISKLQSPIFFEIPVIDQDFTTRLNEIYAPKVLVALDLICKQALEGRYSTFSTFAASLQEDLHLTAFKSKKLVVEMFSNEKFWDSYFDTLKKLQWLNNADYAESATFEDRKDIEYSLTTGNYYIKRILERIMKSYDPSLIGVMAKHLKKHLLEALAAGEKLAKFNTPYIPLYEAFGVILSNHLVATCYSGENQDAPFVYRDPIRCLVNFTDAELKEFAQTLIRHVGKYMDFTSQVMVRMWDGCTENYHRVFDFFITYSRKLGGFVDVLALTQFLLLSCPNSLPVLLGELQCGLLSEEEPKEVPEKFKALYKEEVSFRIGNILYGELSKLITFFYYGYASDNGKVVQKYKQQATWVVNRMLVEQVLAAPKESGIRYLEQVKICKDLLDEIPYCVAQKTRMSDAQTLFKDVVPENPKLRKFGKGLLDWFNPYDLLTQEEYQQSLRSLSEVAKVLKINAKEAMSWAANDSFSREGRVMKEMLAEFVKDPKVWNCLVENLQRPNVGENKRMLSLKLLHDTSVILQLPQEKLREILLAAPNLPDSSTFYGQLVNDIVKRPKKEEEKSPSGNYKKKQAEVMERFLEKQRSFAKKHTAEISDLPKTEDSNICVICRENMSEQDSYGVFALVLQTSVNEAVLNCTWKKFAGKFGYSDAEKEAAVSKNNMGFMSHAAVNTCNHFIHEKCFKEYLIKSRRGICPVCKSTFNTFVVVSDNSEESAASLQGMKIAIEMLQNSVLFDAKMEALEEKYAWLVLKLFLNSLMISDVLGVEEVIAKKRTILRHFINTLTRGKDTEAVCDKFIEMQMGDTMSVPMMTLLYLIKCRYWTLPDKAKANKEVVKLLGLFLRQISIRYAYDKEAKKLVEERIKERQEEIKSDFELAIKSIAYTLSICTDLSEENVANMIKFKNILATAESLLKFFDITLPPFETFFSENSSKSTFTIFGRTVNIDTVFSANPVSMSLLVEPRSFAWGFELDEGMDELIEKNSSIYCKECNKNCPRKGICLVCGTVLCVKSQCCEYELLVHTASCGQGNCVVLLLYDGTVIVTNNLEEGRLISGLYTDDNGGDVYDYARDSSYTLQYEYAKYKLNRQTLELLRDILINSKEVFTMNQYSGIVSDY